MSEEQTTQHWRVLVAGGEQMDVRPGERVEIGRKPLRPLADDGNPRFEVNDGTRSMSKRHALFTVASNGAGVLRDLDSTNGSYVVRAQGDLMRLPSDTDFPLPTSPMRMQFGDVPVDFVRIEEEEFVPRFQVPDLFMYASKDTQAHAEPDAADMSVDDILDLRAGEPTTMFRMTPSAGTVGGVAGTGMVGVSGSVAGVAGQPVGESVAGIAGDNGADDAEDVFANDDEEQISDSMPLAVVAPTDAQDNEPRDLFAEAIAADLPDAEDAQDSAANENMLHVAEQMIVEPDAAVEPEVAAEPAAATESEAIAAPETQDEPVAMASGLDGQNTQPAGQIVTGGITFTPMATPQTAPVETAATDAEGAADPITDPDARFRQSAQSEAATPASQTFESGSVFERVASGELAAQTSMIEVDGMTSEDAKHSTDFSLQFEMARHEELQPFLAMNPSLYDDLYVWLAAQGRPDIDEALARNDGYREYREAIGK